MRAREFIKQEPIEEAVPLIPALATGIGAVLRGATTLGSAALRGIGSAVKPVAQTALSTAATAAGTAIGQSVANKIVGSKPQDQQAVKTALKPGTAVPSFKGTSPAKIVQVDRPDEIGIQDPSVGNTPVRIKIDDLMKSPEVQKVLSQPQS